MVMASGVTLILGFHRRARISFGARPSCSYVKGREEAKAWVLERALQIILHGKASDVEAGMRRNATLGTLS